MTEAENYIHLSKYSRFIDSLGRRETWGETVDRYVNFWIKKYPDSNIDFEEIRSAIYNKEVMPSMRALMTAGKALEKDNVAGFNPVVGSTKVLTKEYGYKKIEELVGIVCHVLNKNGIWTPATFKCYGEQDTYIVSLRKNSNTVINVECSGNHRWYTTTGTVKSTTDLMCGSKNGDKIPFASWKRPCTIDDIDYRLGIVHGLIFGDGTKQYSQERLKGYVIRLCSDSSDLLPFFKGIDGSNVTYPPSFNGDPVVQLFGTFGKTHELKSLPKDDETDSYMIGFFRGWLAADGYVAKRNSQVGICVSDDNIDWFVNNSARYGFVVQNIQELPNKTNFGKRKKRSYNLSIDRSSLTSEDFIIGRKRDFFESLESKFLIVSVESTGERKNVYCAEVPDTNTFVLENGLVTGNCVAVAVTTPRVFDEIFYMLMCGAGAGFSVERQYISQMPEINYEMFESDTTIFVADSKVGWAKALKELIAMLYTGNIPKWDTSKVRPAGARLKTFGGRASGPEPLNELFEYTVRLFQAARGRKLNSLECHDLICKIAQTVIVGSVRRSACISLSNLTDDRMRRAKNGNFGEEHPERYLANNSVMYTEKPDMVSFLNEFMNLLVSKSGERGIVYQKALQDKAKACGREWDGWYLLNPCAEAILRHTGQMCNLSEIVARPGDTSKDLARKAKIAAYLGTLQSTLTDFRYVRKIWKDNAKADRLLGVSLTGIMDHEILSGKAGDEKLKNYLKELKTIVKIANIEMCNRLGISYATQLTLVKPSGTVSQLVSCAAGMHPWIFKYILRKYAQDKKDPLSKLMIDQGVPYSEDEYKYYFHFPLRAPEGAICSEDIDAMYQLNLWKIYRDIWCDGNPSQTIYYNDDTFLKIQSWVWENFDSIGGLSFFPISDNVYKINPFNKITKEEYEKLVSEFPVIDWSKLSDYEKSDETTGSQELSCSGGSCEI